MRVLARLTPVAIAATSAVAFVSSSVKHRGWAGEHRTTSTAFGKKDARNSLQQLRVASGDTNNNVPEMKGGPKMSQALPFLECPAVLAADTRLAGNAGFDPLNFAKDRDELWQYREAEIKHSRLAMLAAVGWPVSELLDRQIADWLGIPSVLDEADRVPSLLNGGWEKVSPAWWGCCLGLTAAIDLYGVTRSRSEDPSYFPGNLGFDPLGLYPASLAGRRRMELSEIKHGRLAMVAVVVYVLNEYVGKSGVVDNFPFVVPFQL